MTVPLRIVFAGTPAFGIPCLQAIHDSPHELVAVYTQPDRPAGRGRVLQASAVKEWALNQQIPVFQPLNFKEEGSIADLASLEADVMVVIAYGLLLPLKVLNTPKYGCINVHASLLPRWRGASPIQQVIAAGDAETGITIMQMDVGLDTGPELARIVCPVTRQETAASLHDKLALLGKASLLEVLDKVGQQRLQPIVQNDSLATYAPKITKQQAHINWHQPAIEIDRQIRAYNPWPIAYTQIGEESLRIFSAQVENGQHNSEPGTIIAIDKLGILVNTGQDFLRLLTIQLAGGKMMPVFTWLNSGKGSHLLNHVLT